MFQTRNRVPPTTTIAQTHTSYSSIQPSSHLPILCLWSVYLFIFSCATELCINNFAFFIYFPLHIWSQNCTLQTATNLFSEVQIVMNYILGRQNYNLQTLCQNYIFFSPLQLLRDTFIFKIVPMINPDGVIVGNYRCSLSGRDLNRNYKTVLKDSFPPIWHIRTMVRK